MPEKKEVTRIGHCCWKIGVKYFFISRVNRFMWIRPEAAQKQEFGILNSVKKYAVQPAKTSTVYLKSGQPLGKNRIYYLPRGMEIWIASRKNSFLLE